MLVLERIERIARLDRLEEQCLRGLVDTLPANGTAPRKVLQHQPLELLDASTAFWKAGVT